MPLSFFHSCHIPNQFSNKKQRTHILISSGLKFAGICRYLFLHRFMHNREPPKTITNFYWTSFFAFVFVLNMAMHKALMIITAQKLANIVLWKADCQESRSKRN